MQRCEKEKDEEDNTAGNHAETAEAAATA